jgi:hypothetical protein
MKDLRHNLGFVSTVGYANRTNGTVNGTGVDVLGFEAVMFLFRSGNVADGTHTYTIEESDDNVTFTAVAASDFNGALPAFGAADDNKFVKVNYNGNKRYVRANVTAAGTTTGGETSATVVLGYPRHYPVKI